MRNKKSVVLIVIGLLILFTQTSFISCMGKSLDDLDIKSNFDCPIIEEWNRTYGSSETEIGYISQMTEDGYIIGATKTISDQGSFLWLINIDFDGNIIWNNTYQEIEPWEIFSLVRTSDNGFIITAGFISPGDNELDVGLLKVDNLGNEVWNRTYGGHSDDIGSAVKQTLDDGFIVVGITESYGAGGKDVWVIKTDSLGNEEWNKTYGFEGWDFGKDVILTQDNGYLILGSQGPFPDYQGWLIKINSNGLEEWNKTYGGYSNDQLYSMSKTTDGGYILSGRARSFDDSFQMWLIKTDENGNELWNRTYGGPSYDYSFSSIESRDGGYIVVGESHIEYSDWDLLIIKTDESGNEEFSWLYGDVGNDGALSIISTSDHGYLISGYKRGDSWDVWLIKLTENYVPANPTITGETQGQYGEEYEYTFVSIDSDEDDIWYYIEWDDGDIEEWIGPYSSGQEITVSHTWDEVDTYTIRAKARDIFDAESDWGTLEVSMPMNQHSYSFPLLQRLLERFPLLYQLFMQVLLEVKSF